MSKAILILLSKSNTCDYYCEDVGKWGYETFFLVSHKLPKKKVKELLSNGYHVKLSNDANITKPECNEYMNEIKAQNHQVIFCFSFSEHYRSIVCEINETLNAKDLRLTQLNFLKNKFKMRNLLYENGLSKGQAYICNQESVDLFHQTNRPGFIKPNKGIGSFAVFKLYKGFNINLIEEFENQLKNDTMYFFEDDTSFILEDFINGREFCFDCIAMNGEVYLLTANEKLLMQEQSHSILEISCICPPVHTSQEDIKNGNKKIQDIFTLLDIQNGFFHVELRFDGSYWELIEINPRAGGGLINRSFYEQYGKATFFDLWLMLGICNDKKNADEFKLKLEYCRQMALSYGYEKRTFIRAFFCKPGKTISKITKNTNLPSPFYEAIYVKEGDTLDNVNAEIFAGMAAWNFDINTPPLQVEEFMATVEKYIEIEYRGGEVES